MTRKCNDIIGTFMEWTLSRSIAPESVLFMCALFTLSSVIRRKVYVPKIDKNGEPLLGGWDCYPHIFSVVVAEPGVITKSTTLGFVESLLDFLPEVERTPNVFTTPVIIETLKKSKDTSVCMLVPEFGTVMEKAGPMIYTTMCDLFDGKKRFGETTIGRGENLLENPVVNMFGATTPDWITENMTQNQISGGFGSRTIWIYEKDARDPVLIHRKRRNKPANLPNYDKLEADLVHDLTQLATGVEGAYEITEDGQDFLEGWYQDLIHADHSDKRRIKGIIHRSPAYVLKLAMLGKLSKSDDLILDVDDFEWAMHHLEKLHKSSLEAFKSIGSNEYTLTMEGMMEFMQSRKRVKRSELLSIFNSEAEPYKLNQLLEGLVMQNKVEIDWTDAKNPLIMLVEKK